MLLYLLRHGEAKPKHQDPERGLSERGRGEVQAVARALGRLKPDIDAVWHSGKVRAEQSAEILAGYLKTPCRISRHAQLAPDDAVQPVADEVGRGDSNLLIVGHLPYLGKLASVLLLGSENNLIDWPSAGLMCLERSEGCWLLRWFLIPEIC